jgi:hypothetical protein
MKSSWGPPCAGEAVVVAPAHVAALAFESIQAVRQNYTIARGRTSGSGFRAYFAHYPKVLT